MNAGQSDNRDAQQTSERSPFVDPEHLSLQIAQKLAEATTVKSVPAPRLSIAHLFLWTTISAVVMAVGRSVFLQRQSEYEPPEFAAMQTAYWYAMSILYGMQGTGLCVEAMRWWRHGRFSLAPGEWLLVVYGGVNLVSLTLHSLREVLVAEPNDLESYLVAYSMRSVVAIVAYIVAVVTIGAWSAWRWIFITSLVMESLEVVLIWGFDAFTWIDWNSRIVFTTWAIQGILWLIAVVGDRRHWPERNWLHWTGVTLFIVMLSFYVAWQMIWQALINS